MKIRLVGAELYREVVRTDGRTNKNYKANSRFSQWFFCAK